MLWLQNLDNAGSEPSGGPVGPQSGKGLAMMWIGRIVVASMAFYELARQWVTR